MGDLSNPRHPIWAFSRLTVVMISLVVTLWANASNFDSTELKTIITMFLIAAGTEGVSQVFSQMRRPEPASVQPPQSPNRK